MLHIIVSIAYCFRFRYLGTYDNTYMIISVGKNDIIPIGYRLDGSLVGLITRTEQDTRLFAHESCEVFFQFQMQIKGSVQISGSGTPCTVYRDHILSRYDKYTS